MSGFEAQIADIRAGAEAASVVAAAAATIDVETGPAAVARALPGTTAAQQATALATAWSERLSAWSRDVGDAGTGLTEVADLYASSDAEAEAAFGGSLLGRLLGVGSW